MKRRPYKIEIKNFDPSGAKFSAIHQVGVDEFRLMWIAANEGAIRGAAPFVSHYDPAVKELLSNVTLRVLQALRSRGHL